MKETFARLLSLTDGENTIPSPGLYFSHPPTLETPRLILRRLRMKDAKDIFRYASDERVARYVLWEPHRSLSDTRAYIRYVRQLYRNALPSSWAIELKESGAVIGTIGFMWYSSENRSAEVGYSLSAEYWNRGLMTEALSRLIASAFDDLGINRLEAQYDIRNPASGRVMEKCGMREEGILRSRIFSKNEYVDVALCSVLASDRNGNQR